MFWLQSSNKSSKESSTSNKPVKIEVPSELSKVSLVNKSLKKLRYHLSSFDIVVKVRTAPDAITEESWGFEDAKKKKNDDSVDICNKCLELKVKLVKKNNMIERDVFNELSKCYLNLETHCISLELAMQLNQEIFQRDKSCENHYAYAYPEFCKINELEAQLQVKDTIINKLKATIHSLRDNANPAIVKQDIDLKAQIQEKVFANASLKNELRKLKGKNVINTAASKPKATTIVPRMFKLNFKLKNKDAHIDYIKHFREHANTLRKIVENARALSPLDSNLDPSFIVRPLDKDKKVRFAGPVTSSSNTQKQVVYIVLWYLDSGCSKHMTRNRYQLTNFVNKYLGSVKFGFTILRDSDTIYSPLDNSVTRILKSGQVKAKADVGIFIGYAPAKKAYRIYNRHTRRIMETIHVDFDELTAMASKQSSSGPALHEMTP
ncbi:hypothetical protein Tco_0903162 [Tanacetum coccineum]